MDIKKESASIVSTPSLEGARSKLDSQLEITKQQSQQLKRQGESQFNELSSRMSSGLSGSESSQQDI